MTADCIIFKADFQGNVSVLLVERKNEPYKGKWAFPGGFMNINETLEQCATRELKEETGLNITSWLPVYTCSNVNRDPRERVITSAFYTILFDGLDSTNVKGGDDAAKAQWIPLTELPEMAFDHSELLRRAMHFAGLQCNSGLTNKLISEAAGDISGSSYEFHPEKNRDKLRFSAGSSDFTDDTVCTFAIADALMNSKDIAVTMQAYCRAYPSRGYGHHFSTWIANPHPAPYGSYGNGAAMRCSAAGFMAKDEEDCIYLAEKTASITHNHPEGIKGAIATSTAIYYLMNGGGKKDVRRDVLERYYPEWKSLTLENLHDEYAFDETCQGTVPVAILSFLESQDYEDCILKAISMGGDADTLAAIAGPMAYAYYREMPQELLQLARTKLPRSFLTLSLQFDSHK